MNSCNILMTTKTDCSSLYLDKHCQLCNNIMENIIVTYRKPWLNDSSIKSIFHLLFRSLKFNFIIYRCLTYPIRILPMSKLWPSCLHPSYVVWNFIIIIFGTSILSIRLIFRDWKLLHFTTTQLQKWINSIEFIQKN